MEAALASSPREEPVVVVAEETGAGPEAVAEDRGGADAAEAPPTSAPSRAPLPLSTRSMGQSLWRLPSQPGQVPRYVQSNFRVKTFVLLSMQLAVVIAVMVVVDLLSPTEKKWRQSPDCRLAFWLVCFATLAVLLGLHIMRDMYPVNYFLLAIVTLLQGVSWGLSYTYFPESLHYQLVCTLFVAVLVATGAFVALSQMALSKRRPWTLISGALFVGWVVGATTNWLVAPYVFNGISQTSLMTSGLVSFALLGLLLGDAGRSLVNCDPDDVMKVIVAMDSALLVVVSVPIFLVSECCVHVQEWITEVDETAAAAENNIVEDGRRPYPHIVGGRMMMEV